MTDYYGYGGSGSSSFIYNASTASTTWGPPGIYTYNNAGAYVGAIVPADISFDPNPQRPVRPVTARQWLDAEIEKTCALGRG